MMYLKSNADIFLVGVGAVLALVCVMSVSTNAETNHDLTHTKLAKLFDYESYKKEFGKSYDSEAEESTRRCLFYARAMAAFVSGVNYKYLNKNYYLALNQMSDWLPEERAMTKNKRKHKMVTRSMTRLETQKLAFMPAKNEKPEETLRKFLEERTDDPVYKDLLDQLLEKSESEPAVQHRRKREVDNEPILKPRDFSFDKLIHLKDTPENDASMPKFVKDVNRNYVGFDQMSMGIKDERIEVDFEEFDSEMDQIEQEPLNDQLESSFSSLKKRNRRKRAKKHLKDEIFVDHRDSGCFNAVRNQGLCGSCYAFSATALAEWNYCINNGVKISLSEQYIVDCGKQYNFTGLNGCDGGFETGVIKFMDTMGMELRTKYPYVGREKTCLYDEDTKVKSVGYIRTDFGVGREIPSRMFEHFLKLTPLLIAIQAYGEFSDYGGGIDDGSGCIKAYENKEDNPHSVVLVGHGRENGQEYWIIRNSYGSSWGERGYYRLSKNVPEYCLVDGLGYAFGTKDGVHFKANPHLNDHYDGTAVREAQLQREAQLKEKRLERTLRQLAY